MKETGIIMSGNHPKLILEGKKTMTRRVIKPQPSRPLVYRTVRGRPELEYWYEPDNGGIAHTYKCPYGQVGDKLWVRETWRVGAEYDALGISGLWNHPVVGYKDEINVSFLHGAGKWRPSIFMPRWASRILLEITEVRAERLQEINNEDAKAEGVIPMTCCLPRAAHYITPFKELWDSLNAKRGYGWETNPWVWVISFKVLDKGVNTFTHDIILPAL